ncbi:LOW QUALITY PROTEIN: hypothetical protein T265_13930 [Opisthorchis viverrini]|uniref:Uncharacterized protein n=1 Tax=Opisthorchis viverrini TaxID=6198 RepID=A0A074ZHR0_OPIVI|nr:LOW QUALITY PROTEIN: hypothetical protein T265_13930 [Opisthorchis viverrini]KER26813.1 LOW QUALITY PROTEIN: hypothetical protein T265_13930 [Opisthorchis viverrini]
MLWSSFLCHPTCANVCCVCCVDSVIPICAFQRDKLTWNSAESLGFDVSGQLNVLHQAASCFTQYDIRDIAIQLYLGNGARCPKWLEREFTDRNIRGSNPTSAPRLPLSRPGQPGSIPTLLQPSGGMTARVLKPNDLIFCNPLPTRLLKTPRKPTTGFALLEAHQAQSPGFRQLEPKLHEVSELHSFVKQLGFAGDSPVTQSRSHRVSVNLNPNCTKQLNVLHQAASCFIGYDIQDIATHAIHNTQLIRLLKILGQPTTGFALRLKHEAAWCSTFSCLTTSQTRYSAGFQSLFEKPNPSTQMSVLH